MCYHPESKEDKAERRALARERLQRLARREEEIAKQKFRERTNEASKSRPYIDGGTY